MVTNTHRADRLDDTGTAQILRPGPGPARRGPGGPARRDLWLPRPQRRGQDHHHPLLAGLIRPDGGTAASWGSIPRPIRWPSRPAAATCRESCASTTTGPPSGSSASSATCAVDGRLGIRPPARRAPGAGPQAADQEPVQGQQAEGRRRPGIDAPPRAAHAGRADGRPRPADAAGGAKLIREARSNGATVFFSSHIMSEVQAVADRVAMIREGEIVEVAETSALIAAPCAT
jgi:hypothetical protein